MKLPKSVTTVTAFSKFLALFLFILLPLVGFYIGMSYQQKIDNREVPVPSSANRIVTITMKDNDQTINAKVGDTIIVSLGEQQNWQVKLSDDKILAAFTNGIFYIHMPQGRYKAIQPGTVEISATGSPKCAKGTMCAMYLLAFHTTVAVSQ